MTDRFSWLRLGVFGYGLALILAMYFAVLSQSRPGTMTWGQTTDIWAASIAISKIEHGLGGGLGYNAISLELARHLTTTGSDIAVHDEGSRALAGRPDVIERAFDAASHLPRSALASGPPEAGGYVTTWAEDIGFADFYNLAFRIFGYHALSTYWLYFLILSLSFVLFVGAYWDNDAGMATLGLVVGGLFLISTANLFSELLPNPAANRYLPTLTLIPCLHLLLAGFDQRPLNATRLALLLLQAVIYALTLSFRTPAIWSVIGSTAILLITACLLYWQSRQAAAPPRPSRLELFRRLEGWRRPFIVALVVVLAGFGYPLARYSQLHRVYFEDMMPHHFRWHTAILGLAVHPDWPRYKPSPRAPDTISDRTGWVLLEDYMHEHRPGESFVSSMNPGLYRARLHDSIMRKKFFEFALINPWYMVELYAYYKPREAFLQIRDMLLTIPIAAWFMSLPLLLCAAALLARARVNLLSVAGVATGIWGASLLPLLWAYSVPFALAEKLWSTVLLLVTLVICAVLVAIRLWRKQVVEPPCLISFTAPSLNSRANFYDTPSVHIATLNSTSAESAGVQMSRTKMS